MKITANMYLIAVTAAVVALGILGVFGAGVVSGVGGWPTFLNPFSKIGETETIIHDERPSIIHQVQSLARLETSSYSIEKLITAEKSGNALRRDFLFGDQIFLIAHGYIVSGVDLSRLAEADIEVVSDNSVWVMLPESEIFIATLDNELTRVYDRNRGWLTRGDDQLETEARQEAEHLILEAACDDGILEHAATNAETHLTAFLTLLGFEEITVIAPVGECDISGPDEESNSSQSRGSGGIWSSIHRG